MTVSALKNAETPARSIEQVLAIPPLVPALEVPPIPQSQSVSQSVSTHGVPAIPQSQSVFTRGDPVKAPT